MENVTRWGLYNMDSIIVSNKMIQILSEEDDWMLNTELEDQVYKSRILNYIAEESRIFVYDNALNYLIFHDKLDIKFDHDNEKIFYKNNNLELNDG